MVFERKACAPFERAVLTKAANVSTHNKTQTLKLVQEAIKLQQEQHAIQTDSKDQMIHKQQDMLIEQRKQLLEAQNLQKQIKHDPNTIQINDLQKIKGLELQDRYNVLETLVKELIGMRAEQQEQKKRDDSLQEVMLQQMQMMMQMMS
jgi:hypothetical protein